MADLQKITGLFKPDGKNPNSKTVLSGKCSSEIHIPVGSRIMMFKNTSDNPKAPPYSLMFSPPDGYVVGGQSSAETPKATQQTTDDLPF